MHVVLSSRRIYVNTMVRYLPNFKVSNSDFTA